MREAQRDLVRRAHERLDAARYLQDGHFLDDAVSRAYYAMAHATEAALLEYDVSPKTHKGLQTQFGKQFVQTGCRSGVEKPRRRRRLEERCDQTSF